jgi:hypothetical protein
MQTGDRHDANKIKFETGLGSSCASHSNPFGCISGVSSRRATYMGMNALLRLKGSNDFN